MTTEDFAAHIKEALGLSAVRCTAVSKMLRTVAVVGGAGGDYALAAQAKGADAFVTGEVKHHEVIAARRRDWLCMKPGTTTRSCRTASG